MNAIVRLIDTVVTLYIWLLIAQAILSWLIAFNVINAFFAPPSPKAFNGRSTCLSKCPRTTVI